MKQFSKIILSLYFAIFIVNCSNLSPYKVPILQGNIVEADDIERLKPGLTKDQVKYLLGTPLASSPLNAKRWDYYYSIKIGDRNFGEKKLTLIFSENGNLDSWNLSES